MSTEERAREELNFCVGLMDTPAIEILEILKHGLVRRLSQSGFGRGTTGFPKLLKVQELSRDLDIVEKSMAYIQGIESSASEGRELVYDRVEEN